MACYGVTLALLAALGWQRHLGPAYYAGLAVAAGIMGWHYTLIRGRERMACFKAFLNNNYVGLAVFAGIAADFLVKAPRP